MSEENIKILALFVWPGTVLLIVIAIAIIFRSSWCDFFSKLKKVKALGVELESEDHVLAEVDVTDRGEQIAMPEQDHKVEPIADSGDPENPWEKVFEFCRMIKDDGAFEAEKAFDSFIASVKGEDIKFLKGYFWSQLFVSGKRHAVIESFEKMYAESYTDVERQTVATWWSECYRQVEDYKRERDVVSKVLQDVNDPNVITSLTVSLANSLMKTNDYYSAHDLLIERLICIENDSEKSRIYKVLAEVEGKIGNSVLSAFCLEKKLDINSNDVEDLFSTAYSQSEANVESLALYNYSLLTEFKSKSENALNNFGVSCDQVALKNKAIESYFKSIEQQNSLSFANLGYKYLNAGFIDHARDMAKKGLASPNPHKSNHALMSAIDKSVENENKQWELYKKRGYEVKQHVHKYVTAYYEDRNMNENPFLGKWVDSNGIILEVLSEDNRIKAEWEHVVSVKSGLGLYGMGQESTYEDKTKMSLNGVFHNNTADISYTGKNDRRTLLSSALDDRLKTHNSLYSYIDNESNWVIFSIDLADTFELVFKKP
ncbi:MULTISPECIES: hypothetical protein [unclassified Maridesulfovibrio]|uniref:hypothetical protein n=1 Tax=unclassified Maridesulfovibrio TaxID=2794999 RepID=UPI003B3D6095